jgi:hypothetical protein
VELLGKFWLEPKLAQNFIPIATDWKATDWLIANCYLQEQILNNSKRPIEDARSCYVVLPHAGVFKVKFNRDVNTQLETFQVESWLNYHGES